MASSTPPLTNLSVAELGHYELESCFGREEHLSSLFSYAESEVGQFYGVYHHLPIGRRRRDHLRGHD